MHAFPQALAARDATAAVALLSPDVVFRSPVVFAEYSGRGAVEPILHAIAEVFDEFRYTSSMVSADGRDQALRFSATIGARTVEGCDFIHLDDDDLVDELVVMVRPLSGIMALAEAMGARLQSSEDPPA